MFDNKGAPFRLPFFFAALFLSAIGLATWKASQQPDHIEIQSSLAPPVPHELEREAPWHLTEMLPGIGKLAASPSLAALPDGSLAAAWIAISRSEEIGRPEQAAIWFSLRSAKGNTWAPPVPIATREDTAGALFAHIRQIDAPVLQARNGVLHLWFVAKGFAGSGWHQLVHRLSADGGKHWSRPQAITRHPLTLPGDATNQTPIALNHGETALPVSSERFHEQQAWLHLDQQGRILARHWEPKPKRPNLQAESRHALLRLRNGKLLLVGNPAGSLNALTLWLGNDQGKWQKMKTLESAADPGAHFTQPALSQGRDGSIHLAYVWREQGIRLRSFNMAWILEGSQ